MAYSQFDSTKPVGTDTGPNVTATANVNDKALRDAIITGQMHGFAFSASGGTARQPTTMLWKNGAIWLRAVVTWGTTGGETYNIKEVVWSLSVNTGGAYDQIDDQVFTYDTAGNLTATTNSGGFTSWLISLIGRVGVNEANIAAALGTTSGLGSMATQNANAVAIAGGFAELAYEREKTTLLGNLAGAIAIDWKVQGVVTVTVTAAGATFTYANLPPGGAGGMSGGLLVKVTNGGLATNLFGSARKPAGFSLSSAGTDWVALMCVDGATPEVTGVTKAVA